MTAGRGPETLELAVEFVVAALDEDQRIALAAMSEQELGGLHFSLGMWIRNQLGLWGDNEALLRNMRGDRIFLHPDSVSAEIIEAVWRRLRGVDASNEL
jgi:hypothetical protein